LTNNSASWSFETTEDGTCVDLLCDANSCIADGCTTNDHCESGVCVSEVLNCDDNSLCTEDSCNPAATGAPGDPNCANDSTFLGDLCNDGNFCTGDACDPLLFCVFPNKPTGLACDDFLTCTNNDQCCEGTCSGVSVCNDGNQCTDDFGDEQNGCVCTIVPSFPGTPCTDGNACTEGEICDGFGTTDSCVGAVPVNCDDNNPCTDDSCDPAAGAGGCGLGGNGCLHTNNTSACDDNTLCNGREVCGGGTCNSGPALDCDDGQCCTIDSCDPAVGCVYTANPDRPVFVSQPSLGACAVLWPPDHGYVDFALASTGAAATSQCGIASIQFASCNSSQPDNGTDVGDGNSTRDCVYAPDTLSTRAERDGACSPVGRVYTAAVSATDVCGNTTTSNSFEVGVWHDRGHSPDGPYFSANPGSNQNDTRVGNAGTSGPGCGSGSACVNGTTKDMSDINPEIEISSGASITVDDLILEKASGGNVNLVWNQQHQAGTIVTGFHIYRLDPVTLLWTKIADVTKQTNSYLDPVLNDGLNHQYKVTAVIK
jgi:hypothetical protein